MNKVFKVIWSEARNAYVVVSEMAKSHGTKSCSTKKLLAMLIATGVMTCASVAPAMATNLAPEDTKIEIGSGAAAKGSEGVAIGRNSEASASGYATAIGGDAKATGSKSTVVGNYSKATEAGTISIGYGNLSSGANAITIGHEAIAAGMNSFAFGSEAKANQEAGIAFGTKSFSNALGAIAIGNSAQALGTNSIAIGRQAIASKEYSVVIGAHTDKKGTGSNVTAVGQQTEVLGNHSTAVGMAAKANVERANAIGSYANALAEGSVALGAGSTASRKAGYQGYDPLTGDKSADTSFAWKSTKGAVSVGGVGVTRQIINVAAGSEDTDAVNGSQLHAVATEASKHSVVTEGDNITVTPEQAEDGRMQYKVALNNDILLSGDNDAFVNISGSNGSVWASSSVAAGNVIMDATTATVSGLSNKTTAYDGFANGEGKAATEEQLKEISKVADNANQGWSLSTNGDAASKVAPGETVDFSGDKNISVSNNGKDVKVELNKDIDVNYVQTNALNSKYNLSVGTMAENGIMPFFVNSTGAFYAAHNKFSVDKDGNVNANSVQTNALNSKYNLSVGTMAENGIMPFFVNSTGAFYAANNKFSVDKDGKVTATAGEIGNVVLNNGVFYKNSALRDGELFIGDNDGNYSQITTKGAKLGQVVIAADGKISNVAAGVADTDAVNVGQLNAAVEAGNTDTHIKPGEYGVGADNKVIMDVVDKNGNKVDTVTIKDVAKASDVGDVNNIADDIKNGEGKTTVVDAVNNLNNKVGDLQYSKVEKGDIADGDSTTTAIGKLDQKLTDVAATAAKHTKVKGSSNITVTNTAKEGEAANYKVELNKDIDVDTVKANSVTTGQTVMNNDGVKVGADVSLNKDGLNVGKDVSVTGTAVKAGDTTITDKGLEIKGGPSVTKDGIYAGDNKITGVAEGKENTDAVNVGQLKKSETTINNRIDGVENQVINNTNRINKLGSRVNKVGAGAAALAALHPMDFDPDDKLTFSAGYGNYAGENAAAIGAYYRPDEKVMFSVAGTVGNGENMVNAGVSFALDRTNHVSNSRTALAREVIDLRGQLAVMGAKMAKMEKAFGMLDETKTKLFPDVPANHWAYEYIAKLAGNGYIEGYPDGNFGGDRLMTRYEFAAMLYRAIENGAALEEKIIKEFEPELGRIRVDRISGEDGDRDKIERVRVNDTKGERDHYGNKLAK